MRETVSTIKPGEAFIHNGTLYFFARDVYFPACGMRQMDVYRWDGFEFVLQTMIFYNDTEIEIVSAYDIDIPVS